MGARACPMCGQRMDGARRDNGSRAGHTAVGHLRIPTNEVCPDCDYFEEDEDSGKLRGE
jgi:hypothetical protein